MTVNLRVLCWDHSRCTGPMAAAAAAYKSHQPAVRIELSRRPLAQFNDQPPWEVEGQHDLIFVDHPMTGAVAAREALVPLDTVLSTTVLRQIGAETLAASHDSYSWAGHQWAVGVDAACQVAAVRHDRLRELAVDVPRTWDEVLGLAKRTPGAVALPLYPSDAMCTLASLSAGAGLAVGDAPTWLRAEAVEFLVELSRLIDPVCFGLNPPRLLDLMAGDDPIAYVPFVFGYANLVTPALTFTDIPGIDGEPRGSVLGGAGLAVFPDSPHVEEAAQFAAWCMGAAVQRDIMLPAGGQPGNRRVWDDPGTDRTGFFQATRRSIDAAYVRPREPWWPAFHREAGEYLVTELGDGATASAIERGLATLAQRHQDQQAARSEAVS